MAIAGPFSPLSFIICLTVLRRISPCAPGGRVTRLREALTASRARDGVGRQSYASGDDDGKDAADPSSQGAVTPCRHVQIPSRYDDCSLPGLSFAEGQRVESGLRGEQRESVAKKEQELTVGITVKMKEL